MKLYAVGDIFLKSKDGSNPFEYVSEIWKDKDLLFGNLEVVLSKKRDEKEKSVIIRSEPENIKFLKKEGFDVLNIANNHIMDFGEVGFCETIKELEKNELKYIGTTIRYKNNNYTILNIDNAKIGFLGYYSGGKLDSTKNIILNPIEEKKILEDINYLKNQCNYVIVSLHWGIENIYFPSPEQIKLARKLIDNGASVILGHGPHVIQGIERYKSGLIAYSLGNFNFANSMPTKAKTDLSMILSINLTSTEIEFKSIPVKIDNNFKPKSLSKEENNVFSNSIKKLSVLVQNNQVNEKFWFEHIAVEYLSGNLKSYIKRTKKYGFKHFLECIFWLFSPFCINCYLGIFRKILKMRIFNEFK